MDNEKGDITPLPPDYTGDYNVDIINDIVRSPKSSKSKVSRFEKNLFRHGTFTFDSDELIKTMDKQSKHNISQELTHFYYDEQQLSELIGDMKSRIYRYLTWSSYFSEKVPSHWGDYPIKNRTIFMDLVEAEKKHVQLSPTLIYAAVLHPNISNGALCGKSQLLDVNQLAILVARRTEYTTGVDEAIQAQIKFGMTQEQVQDATKQALNILKTFKEKSKKTT